MSACETVPRVCQNISGLTIFQNILLKKMYTTFLKDSYSQSTTCCIVHCIVTAALITLYHLNCHFIYSLSVHADNVWKLSSVQYKTLCQNQKSLEMLQKSEWTFLGTSVYLKYKASNLCCSGTTQWKRINAVILIDVCTFILHCGWQNNTHSCCICALCVWRIIISIQVHNHYGNLLQMLSLSLSFTDGLLRKSTSHSNKLFKYIKMSWKQ